MTRLIVNADDLGYGEGVNRGILEAHERGIVTSASLMVDGPAAVGGVELARRSSRLGVGLHAVVDGLDAGRCGDELERQLARFEALVGHPPTHVDSHHHRHREPELAAVFAAFATRNALRLRGRDAPYEGRFYGAGNVDVAGLLRLLDGFRGDVELGCHPGRTETLDSSYTVERQTELRTLTDARVRRRVAELGIELIRWDEL